MIFSFQETCLTFCAIVRWLLPHFSGDKLEEKLLYYIRVNMVIKGEFSQKHNLFRNSPLISYTHNGDVTH